MDKSYILAFVSSIRTLFETMLMLPVTVNAPKLKTDRESTYDVSGIIGMSGSIVGTAVLSLSSETAEKLVEKFTGTPLSALDEDFADAIGELINMISGGAKAKFEDKGVTISCPSVVIGHDHLIFGQKDVVAITIPCQCECGPFTLEFAMREAQQQQAEAAA